MIWVGKGAEGFGGGMYIYILACTGGLSGHFGMDWMLPKVEFDFRF